MTICLSATRSSGPCVLTVYPRSARQPLQLRKRFGPFSGLRSPAVLPVSFAILALRVSAIYSVPCLLQAHCIPIAALTRIFRDLADGHGRRGAYPAWA